jgi:small ligand-binding sensory domain FIST
MTRCAAAVSEHPVATQAAGEVIGSALEQLGPGDPPHLAFVFATAAHTGVLEDVVQAIREVLRPAVLVGSTAVSVVGGDREVEEAPGLSLLAVRLGAGSPTPQPVRLVVVPTGDADGWAVFGMPPAEPGSTLVLCPDPFSFPAERFLDGLAEHAPGVTVVGGLASAARGPGGNRLVLDGAVHADGAVGVILAPGTDVSTVVSQGCRPIGEPLVVTRSEGTLIEELASEPALTRLLRTLERLDARDRSLAAQGLHVGRVVDEHKDVYGRGDFLIRNVLGALRERDAVAVGDDIGVGTIVQFQVRDADSADDDLREALAGREAAGALLFTCNGRGVRLFGRPHHDAEAVAAVSGGATAGMFCAGELGPVGGRAWLHGFTASLLLFGS